MLAAPVAPVITSFEASGVSDCGGVDGRIEVSLAENSYDVEYSLNGEDWLSEANFEALLAVNYDVFVRNTNAINCQDTLENIKIIMPTTPSIIEPGIIPISDCGEEDAILRITTDLDTTEYSKDGQNRQASNEIAD